MFSYGYVVGCCQAEGPTAGDEEESEKSVSEVNDEDDDEEGSGEVSFYTFLRHCLVVCGNYLHDIYLVLFISCRRRMMIREWTDNNLCRF